MSASKQLLLMPSGASIYSQPSASYTAASTTGVTVTFRLNPALTVVSGYTGFTAEFVAVHEQGATNFAVFACLKRETAGLRSSCTFYSCFRLKMQTRTRLHPLANLQ